MKMTGRSEIYTTIYHTDGYLLFGKENGEFFKFYSNNSSYVKIRDFLL